MTILGALFDRRSVENPTRPLTDATLLDVLGGGPTDAGVSVTPESALGVLAYYRGVALLSGLIGALPWHAYRRRPDGAREKIDSPIITRPHPDKTPFEVKEYLGTSLFTLGNAYARKHRDGVGRVRELEPLHPAKVHVARSDTWIRPNRNPTGKRFFVDGSHESFDPWDVLHIPGLSYDGLVGLSPVGVARQAIGAGLAAERYSSRMWARGALMQGVLQTEQELEETEARAVQQRWADKTAGVDNHWRIPVLDRGLKFEPIALPPQDAQFLETRRFTVADMARLLGLPPHLLGDVERSTSWGSGIEQQNMQMLTYTLDPFLVRIEQRATAELILDGAVYVKFNRSALLRADTATRFLAHQRAVNNGWMNPDEVRELEDLDPIPDGAGAAFWRPGNLLPLNQESNNDG